MDQQDKPRIAEIRRANHLADVFAAARAAGIDDRALMEAIRSALLGPIAAEKERRRRANMAASQAISGRRDDGSPPPTLPIPDEIMELVIATGDLSKLTTRQRMAYYAMRCQRAGLDPGTAPFQYITFERTGKLQLYATKTATDQLIATRRLSVRIVERKMIPKAGIYTVRCAVTTPDGNVIEDCADVSVEGLRGDSLCNQLMKAITKAKRRTVLSACGLGELDETEVETIPDAQKVTADLPPAVETTARAELPAAKEDKGADLEGEDDGWGESGRE